ncbi:MAG: hypothetical protein HRU18_11040 [Pseudoalteromonas sp.]|uniref:hypothetical protein n=1 Tax=Pseudoalteromonas sp. TaxID=53249 RepID=UPI001D80A220|nr:hypothetical protein [Pseudoalteromonas sp.]NRA78734.1 hypothetical protein [Pseudoalteromonas sp.]
MGILGLIGNLLGIGKNALENRSKLKRLKAEQEFKIIEAQTNAQVDRIMSNTDSDNQIDLITAQNKKYTLKDEVVTYLFLVPVFVATIVPFVTAYETGSWINLNTYVKDSYLALDELPEWYKYVLGAVVIDVLGFRSFARKLVDKYINKK